MGTFFVSLQLWHWLILAIALFSIEMLGITGFLLGAAAAALLLALVTGFIPDLAWSYQLLLYGLSAVIFTTWYWYRFNRFNEQTDEPQLNDRAGQMVGTVVNLPAGLPNGQGRVQIGDTSWQLRAQTSLVPGSQVIVIASEGMALLVELH